jgi:chromate transporter
MSAAWETFAIFLRLGVTSFGGPIAHLGYFREEFVVRRRWLTEAEYADLVALAHFLPGPASSQVGFAIGLRRAGRIGGLAAFIGFTAPSALLMAGAAAGLTWMATPWGEALAHGLKLVAVAIVAHAVIGMARALLVDAVTLAIAIFGCALVLTTRDVYAQFAAILAGGAALALWRAKARMSGFALSDVPRRAWLQGALVSGLVAGLTLTVSAVGANDPLLALVGACLRTGLFAFGGGHVVLPLMEAEVVDRGWVSADAFLAGYGAAQAMPGPLFSFAAYLGAVHYGPLGAILATAAIFAPGLVLIATLAPFWERLREDLFWRAFSTGAGAAVVGVLAAAWLDPIAIGSIASPADALIAALGAAVLVAGRAPIPLVILTLALAGAAATAWT